MPAYTVHAPTMAPADPVARGERLVFIRDGFRWWAAILPPVWMLAHGQLIALGGYLAAAFALTALADAVAGPEAAFIALVALNIATGFEAAGIQRWTLERNGYRLIGTVSGDDLESCERRFLDALPST